MSDNGDDAVQPPDPAGRLRLADVVEAAQDGAAGSPAGRKDDLSGGHGPFAGREASATTGPLAATAVARRRRALAELLGEFRRTAVLAPLGEGPGSEEERGFLCADLNRVRFLLAFSDEAALARYALARGDGAREWAYRTVLGARLLDVAVPAAGVPCGVALDCADGEDGMVFPPVRGIVPDSVAVDFHEGDEDTEGRP
ncbi:hypothetical protein [Streptomyces tremellae]